MRRGKNSAISVTCSTIRDVISFSYLHSIQRTKNLGVLLDVDPYPDSGCFPDHETKKPDFYDMEFFIRNFKEGQVILELPPVATIDADSRSECGFAFRVRIRIQPSKKNAEP
jgi:hypothetical protein